MLFLSVLLLSSFPYSSLSEVIDCNATESTDKCYNKTIACSSTEDCIIHCNGDYSCAFSTIICPQSQLAKCVLTCNDHFACKNIEITAHSSFSVNIISNGYESLSYSNIYCPSISRSNSCNITYIGTQNGLNNINIYSIYTYDAINIECKSTNDCWSNTNSPVLHYGDSAYSKMCTIYTANKCEANNILIANDNPLSTAIAYSASTTMILQNDDTVNVLINDKYDNKSVHKKLNNALLFISIGICCGLLISICCCLALFCFHSKHTQPKLRISTPKKRSIPTKKLSPSLHKLSPQLKPSMVELSSVDFMNKMVTMSDRTPTNEGIVVTVERYENSTNYCDEEPSIQRIHSPNLGFNCVKSLSETMNDNITGQVQEFVVYGDDELDVTYNTQY